MQNLCHENEFFSHANKNHFHINGFLLSVQMFFWDRYWGRAGHLLAKFFALSSDKRRINSLLNFSRPTFPPLSKVVKSSLDIKG